jgi:hypothetical protein
VSEGQEKEPFDHESALRSAFEACNEKVQSLPRHPHRFAPHRLVSPAPPIGPPSGEHWPAPPTREERERDAEMQLWEVIVCHAVAAKHADPIDFAKKVIEAKRGFFPPLPAKPRTPNGVRVVDSIYCPHCQLPMKIVGPAPVSVSPIDGPPEHDTGEAFEP